MYIHNNSRAFPLRTTWIIERESNQESEHHTNLDLRKPNTEAKQNSFDKKQGQLSPAFNEILPCDIFILDVSTPETDVHVLEVTGHKPKPTQKINRLSVLKGVCVCKSVSSFNWTHYQRSAGRGQVTRLCSKSVCPSSPCAA